MLFRSEDGQDDVGPGHVARLGHPDEGEVAEGDDGDEELDGEYEGLCAVEDGGADGGEDEADEDEDGAADARLVVGEAVGAHHLEQQGRGRVEEADVDGEGEEQEPDLDGVEKGADRLAEAELGRLGGRTDGGWRRGRDDDGWDAAGSRLGRMKKKKS